MSWIKLILFSSMVMSVLFSSLSNPMMIVVIIIIQSLLVCMYLFVALNTSWYSYILFLIFMGGLMVLFIYICSLASNEEMKRSISNWALVTGVSFIFFIVFTEDKKVIQISMDKIMFIMKMMMSINMYIIVITMFYLLFTLVVVVKISENNLGPIRSFKK